MEVFVQLVISGMVNGAIYGLIAIGFVLIYKCSAVLNFAQGHMVLIGAYVFWFFKGQVGLGLIPSFFCCATVTFLAGMIIERITLRPLVGQSILSMITVTIFLSLILEGVACIIWGSNPLPKVEIFPRGSVPFGGLNIMTDNILSFFFAFLIMVVLIIFFQYTNLGLAMRGVAEGHQIVQSMGIRVKTILTISWGIAGVAGALFAHYMTWVQLESFTLTDSVWYVVMIIVGGLGSIEGTIFGVIFAVFLKETISVVGPVLEGNIPFLPTGAGSGFLLVGIGGIAVLFLILEPRGLAHRWKLFKTYYRLWPFGY